MLAIRAKNCWRFLQNCSPPFGESKLRGSAKAFSATGRMFSFLPTWKLFREALRIHVCAIIFSPFGIFRDGCNYTLFLFFVNEAVFDRGLGL